MKILKCENCGSMFLAKYPSEYGRKYCSINCHLINLHKAMIKERVKIKCDECNIFFPLLPGDVRIRKYCSSKCGDIAGGKKRSGKNNTSWKGGVSNFHGYLMITHGKDSMKLLHRVIMEKYLGRKLFLSELVHHINGDKKDNRIENLQLVNRSEHMNIHREEIRALMNKKN